MTSTKFFVGVFLIAKLSCVWTSGAEDIGQWDVQVYSTSVDWICTSDADCTTLGSSCVDQKCQCPSGYVFNAAMTSCLRVAKNYDDYCKETVQCSAFLKAGGFCNNNRCTCTKGYHYIHGQCRKSSGLNEKCRTDDDCYVNSDFGAFSCKNETCVCRDGYYQREYRTCRLEATEPGAECTIDLDCTYNKDAKCDPTFSKCGVKPTNMITNIGFRGSVYEAPHTWENAVSNLERVSHKGCTSDNECAILGEALCSSASGMCVCKPGHFFDPKVPRCNAEIGEKCKKGDTNIIQGSTCRFGQWSCRGATVPSKNNRVCLEATTSYDGFCRYDEQCYVFGPDAFCSNQACTCKKGSHYSSIYKFCWVNKGYGEKCVVEEDCEVPGFGSRLECNSSSICSCPNGTHLNAIGSACVKDIPVLGDACSRNIDCKGLKNAGCYEGRCTCDSYYFAKSGECVNGNLAPCVKDDECENEHSICRRERCGCADPYVPEGVDACVEGIPFGGHCRIDAECNANTTGSYCNSISKCDCHENYRYFDGRCAKIKGFDEKCNWETDVCWDEYHPDSMECNISTCRCKQGYKPSYNWIFCYEEPKLPNSASKHLFSSLFFLTMISTAFMELL